MDEFLLCECFLLGSHELKGLSKEEILATYPVLGSSCGKCLSELDSFIQRMGSLC